MGVTATVIGVAAFWPDREPAPGLSPAAAARAYRFEDVTAEANINDLATRTWGANFVDYDANGWPDLLINRHLRRPLLVANEGGTFRRRRFDDLEHPPDGRSYYDRHACAWGEASGDGRLDLFCASGAQKGEGTGPNQLLIQGDRGYLEDRARAYGVVDPYGRGRSANWIDYNRDGSLDLFVGNEYRLRHPNVLFRNDRPPFTRVSAGIGEVLATTTSSAADWDNNGRADLVVTAHGDRGATPYRNFGGRFYRSRVNGISGLPWLSVAWGDFNGDGRIDAAATALDRLIVFRNTLTGFRPVYSRYLSAGRNAAWLDLDNDGDLDLFVVQGRRDGINKADFIVVRSKGGFSARFGRSYRGPRSGNGDSVVTADYDRDGGVDVFVTNGYDQARGRFQLLRNRSTRGNWALLDLAGGPRNPLAFGARVRVRTPRRNLWRHVTDGAVFRGQSETGPVHVGLGPAATARVKVVWPGGRADCLTIVANQRVTVRRGSNPC